MRLELVAISCKTFVVTLMTLYRSNNFSNQRFVVTIQICDGLVSNLVMSDCFKHFFYANWFAKLIFQKLT